MVRWVQPPVLYMHRYNITPSVRSYIANWMNWVVVSMRLSTSVLFLGMAIFDRFIATALASDSNEPWATSGACLALAAKVESLGAPLLADYLDYMDNSSSVEQLARAEISVLTILDYRMSFIPTTYSVMCDTLSVLSRFTPDYVNMVFYLAELSLMEYKLQSLSPGQLATTCCCYALMVLPQPITVFDLLSTDGLSSIDAEVASAMVTLSQVHDVCTQAAANRNPYVSTTKYRTAAAVSPVLVMFDGR